MKDKWSKALTLCTGKCKHKKKGGGGSGDCDCDAILESLGSPEDCNDKSIIELLCAIADNLPIDIDLEEIIELLNEILNSIEAGQCDCDAILEALGSPEDCDGQSIIDILCSIANNLPIGGGGICDSTCNTSEDGIIEYAVDEAVRITAIYASYIVGSGNPDGILIDIGTEDDAEVFTSLCKLRAVQVIANGKTSDFETTLTHPLLITPPEGEKVVIKASVIGGTENDKVLLTVFNCLESQ